MKKEKDNAFIEKEEASNFVMYVEIINLINLENDINSLIIELKQVELSKKKYEDAVEKYEKNNEELKDGNKLLRSIESEKVNKKNENQMKRKKEKIEAQKAILSNLKILNLHLFSMITQTKLSCYCYYILFNKIFTIYK